MKLVLAELSNPILSDKNRVTEWIIESQSLFTQYVQGLVQQWEGKEGNFVLPKDNNIMEISKFMEIIFNPFSIDINNRKILNKLYSDLDVLAKTEEIYLQTRQMMQGLIGYLMELEQRSEYILDFEWEFDLPAIFKAVGIKHGIMEDDYFEKLIRYIKIISQVMGIKIVTFVNIRSFLDDVQMEQLLREAVYQELQILLIENQERACLKDVFRYIIDYDKCEIF